MTRRAKLTKRAVDSFEPETRVFIVWDTELKGFSLRVYPSGKKGFFYRYRVGGGRGATVREPLIGDLGAITPDEARSIAKDWSAQVRNGGDPSADRQARRDAPLMSELFERYLSEHAEKHKKPSSLAEDERLIRIFLRTAFGRMKVAEVTRGDISAFHTGLADRPYRANRSVALLSKAFNLAEVWGMRADGSNPCRHLKKFKEEKRRRYLSEREFASLAAALHAAERGKIVENGKPIHVSLYAVAAIRLLVFTGARRGEILGLRWDWVNWGAQRLELPDSKTGAKNIPLSAPALKTLSNIPCIEGNPFVIVGGKEGSSLVNLKKPWDVIRRAARLEDVRIHDLRHSFASVGAGSGLGLPIIGAIMGHADSATTARYAHLSDDPIKAASEQIGVRITGMMSTDENGAAVVELNAKRERIAK